MSKQTVLFLHALSSLHPGSGTALGVVDLPVQRERHTGWPLIPGSSLKGVLRNVARERCGNDKEIECVFGPDTTSASEHAGAVSVSDARLVAFPVRSLRGVFAWTTCPAVLERFARDIRLLTGLTGIPPWPSVSKGRIVAPDTLTVQTGSVSTVVLEEFDFVVCGEQEKQTLTKLAEWLGENALNDKDTRKRFSTHLALLHDDDFGHFVKTATEVTARIALNYETKTVSKGALFYEEYVPPETLFYSVIIASPSRIPKGNGTTGLSAEEVMARVVTWTPPVVQIGAGETVGKGLCNVKLCDSEEVR